MPAVFIVISTLFFTCMGTCVKYLSAIASHEIALWRGLIAALACCALLRAKGISLVGNNPRLLLLRGIVGSLGLHLYFMSLQRLHFSTAVSLQHLAPIFTVLISSLLIKERPSAKQWGLLFVAFGGALLTQNFGGIVASTYFVLGVVAAALGGSAYVVIRVLGTSEHPLVIMLYLAGATIIVALPLGIGSWQTPTLNQFMVLIIMGISALAAQFFMTLAYQRAPAPKVVHLTYLNLVWAFLMGEFFWQEAHSVQNALGIVMIICAAVLSNLDKQSISRLKTGYFKIRSNHKNKYRNA